jgi:medium-chain acyl-[acyl-carrier-protein] hydrolase
LNFEWGREYHKGLRRSMESPRAWLSCPLPQPAARLRLYCFPYAGGGASVFRNWGRGFSPAIEVCAVQPPGREQRLAEKPFTQFSPYVEAIAAGIAPSLSLPYALFGHSLGALAAFECSRILRANSLGAPVALFVSGCRAPQAPFRDTHTRELSDEQFLDELRRLNGTPKEALEHPELMALLLPLLRGDFSVYESYEYRPQSPLDCPIHAFGGTGDARVTQFDLAAWGAETSGPSSVRMFPGDHFFLHAAQRAITQAMTLELQGV